MRTFLVEFANLLDDVIIYPGRIFIVGDFNLHVDKYDDHDAIAFLDLLEQFDLKQCVNTSTHKHGHTLDLVITRRSDVFVTSVDVSFQLPSDHAVVTCTLAIPRPRPVKVFVNHRQLRNINTKNLANDIQSSSLIVDPKASSTLCRINLKTQLYCYGLAFRPHYNAHIRIKRSAKTELFEYALQSGTI